MEQKILTLRIDVQDFILLKQTQKNMKITSLNTVLKDLIFNDYSIYKLYDRSVEHKNNNKSNKY